MYFIYYMNKTMTIAPSCFFNMNPKNRGQHVSFELVSRIMRFVDYRLEKLSSTQPLAVRGLGVGDCDRIFW